MLPAVGPSKVEWTLKTGSLGTFPNPTIFPSRLQRVGPKRTGLELRINVERGHSRDQMGSLLLVTNDVPEIKGLRLPSVTTLLRMSRIFKVVEETDPTRYGSQDFSRLRLFEEHSRTENPNHRGRPKFLCVLILRLRMLVALLVLVKDSWMITVRVGNREEYLVLE